MTLKDCARWAAYIALFALPFLPFVVVDSLYFPYITGKNFAFRMLVEAGFAAYVLLAALDAKYRPKFSWTLVAFVAFVAWMAIADLFAVNALKAFWSNFERMDGWVTLIHLLMLFFLSSVLSVDRLWKNWWRVFLGVTAVVCGYGLLQLAGVLPIHQGGVRVDASFGNAIYLAVYLVFAFAMTVWQAAVSKGALRFWFVALAILEMVVLFASSSRGAVLGLAAGIVLGAVIWLIETRKESHAGAALLGRRIAIGLLAGLALLGGAFFLARDTALVKGEPTLARLATVFSLGSELSVRAHIWQIALKGVAERPIAGWGQEGFNYIFNKFYEPSLYGQEAWFDRAHNAYIDWMVAGGVPATLLFLLLLAAAVIALYRAEDLPPIERAVFIGAILAYAIQAIVVFDNLFSYLPLVMLLAMAHEASGRKMPALDRLPSISSAEGKGVAATVAVALAIALVWLVNVPGIRAADELIAGLSREPETGLPLLKQALAEKSFADQEIREQLVNYAAEVIHRPDISDSAKAAAYTLANAEMEKQLAATPRDARLRFQYATLLDAAGDFKGAIGQLDLGLAESPVKQLLIIRKGLELWQLNDPHDARLTFDAALALDPSYTDAVAPAAAGRIIDGDTSGAKQLLQASFGTAVVDNDMLFYAYYQTHQYADLIAIAQARVDATHGEAAARLRLAQAYAAAGRFADAHAEIASTIAAHPEAKAAGDALLKQLAAIGK